MGWGKGGSSAVGSPYRIASLLSSYRIEIRARARPPHCHRERMRRDLTGCSRAETCQKRRSALIISSPGNRRERRGSTGSAGLHADVEHDRRAERERERERERRGTGDRAASMHVIDVQSKHTDPVLQIRDAGLG
jgi:hypothetical protein